MLLAVFPSGTLFTRFTLGLHSSSESSESGLHYISTLVTLATTYSTYSTRYYVYSRKKGSSLPPWLRWSMSTAAAAALIAFLPHWRSLGPTMTMTSLIPIVFLVLLQGSGTTKLIHA